MTKEVLYEYLGTNGIVCTPVHLEGIYYVRKVRLVAAPDKFLTKDGSALKSSVIVPEDEVHLWYEV